MSDLKEVSSAAESKSEDALDNLLDSALGDFDKPLPKVTTITEAANVAGTSGKNTQKLSEPDSSQWSEEFKQFQDAMQTFLKDDPNFRAELDQYTRGEISSEKGSQFETSLEDAMKAIADGTQSIPEPSAEELSQFFNNLGLTDGSKFQNGDQLPDFMPFMQNVMQNLLSKELLYPALKDIVNKYPDWLAENRQTLDSKAFEKYSHQYDLMKKICEEFETNHGTSTDERTKSFEKILALMQKMQEYGNPPKDLMGEVTPDLPFTEQGDFKMNGLQEQCTVM